MRPKKIAKVLLTLLALSIAVSSMITPSFFDANYDLLLNSFSILLALIVAFIPLGFGFLPSIIKSYNDRATDQIGDNQELIDKYTEYFANRINEFFSEIKANTVLCIIGYLIVFVLFHMKGSDIPGIQWPIENVWWSKDRVYYTLSLFIFSTAIYALWDTIMASFMVIQLYILMDFKEDESNDVMENNEH